MYSYAGPGPVSLKPEVRTFFNRWLFEDGNHYVFTYVQDNKPVAFEHWNVEGNIVPNTPGFWLASDGIQAQVRHLFISYSATEILCFCHYHTEWLNPPGNAAFAALGVLALAEQVRFFNVSFPHAKIHTLFDAGLTGRVTDCKTALWLAKKDAAFRIAGGMVHSRYRKKDLEMPDETFSLSRFEKITGLRSGIRTHKPKGGSSSFYERFMSDR